MQGQKLCFKEGKSISLSSGGPDEQCLGEKERALRSVVTLTQFFIYLLALDKRHESKTSQIRSELFIRVRCVGIYPSMQRILKIESPDQRQNLMDRQLKGNSLFSFSMTNFQEMSVGHDGICFRGNNMLLLSDVTLTGSRLHVKVSNPDAKK